MSMLEGKTVYLLGCPAQVSDGCGNAADCSLIGLFDVEEFLPYEPGAYCFEDGFLLVPTTSDHENIENPMFFVTAWDFDAQVHPREHALQLVAEREMAF